MSIRYKKSDGSIITIPTGGSSDSSEWFGTTAELEEQFDSIPNGTKINILDDDDGNTIQKEIDAINNNLTATDSTKFRFATDGEGNYGYLKADGSFIPFKSGVKETVTVMYFAYGGANMYNATVAKKNGTKFIVLNVSGTIDTDTMTITYSSNTFTVTSKIKEKYRYVNDSQSLNDVTYEATKEWVEKDVNVGDTICTVTLNNSRNQLIIECE